MTYHQPITACSRLGNTCPSRRNCERHEMPRSEDYPAAALNSRRDAGANCCDMVIWIEQPVSTVGTTLVVTHFPCMDCAKAIVQAGIVKVLVPYPTPEFLERWAEHVSRSKALFDECGVEVEYVS